MTAYLVGGVPDMILQEDLIDLAEMAEYLKRTVPASEWCKDEVFMSSFDPGLLWG